MNNQWWRSAVIYQIYPRSFLDTANDGTGDLQGITSKLDYVKSLGVDAIWISPFFPSPMKDFGYDVSNYRGVDPIFGTLDDFDTLLEQAHARDLKIIIDLVFSHTSDMHPWFNDPSKKDWYVWADPKPDGTPPNNWQSVFGGPAWEWNARHEQYYLHNFLKEQPDLNFHNADVQTEILDICRFWLDRGVDGFRLDVVNFYFHDPELRDNPPRTDNSFATQFEEPTPYSQQQHIFDKSRPENLDFIRKLRILTDSYKDRFLIGEIGDDHPYDRAREYTHGHTHLHTCYNTHMMAGTHKDLTEELIREPVEHFLQIQPYESAKTVHSWPCWAFSNHDVVRAASRWYELYKHDPDFSKMLIALLGCLPGTLCLYHGEELGLPEAKIPFKALQDPWARETWPKWQGRDGCRTPMPWQSNAPNMGFSSAKPWLPIPKSHNQLSVDLQLCDKKSTLAFTQHFLHWRKTQPNLLQPNFEFVQTSHSSIIHIKRIGKENATECIFNLSSQETTYHGKNLKAYGFFIDGWLENV